MASSPLPAQMTTAGDLLRSYWCREQSKHLLTVKAAKHPEQLSAVLVQDKSIDNL